MTTDWILVTGGAGYVGSHCVVELLKEGFNVVIVDNLSNSCKESVERIEKLAGKSVPFYQADLRDKEAIKKVFLKYCSEGRKVVCVMHFAALKAVGESCAFPLKYYTNNVTGSANLIEVMMEFEVKKIVFSSSATVYGQPQYLPVDEQHPTGNCTNPYGRTKLFMEEIFKDVCLANSDWSCSLLRYFNPTGAHPSGDIGEDPQGVPSNLMPFVAQVAVGRRDILSVFGSDFDTQDGTGCRDYIHVMDLAAGHLAALKQILEPSFAGVKVYNLGTGKGATVLELVRAFEEASGKQIPYKLVGRRAGDVASCFASSGLAERELGFKAEKSLLEMCKSEYNWQVKNPKGYRA